VLDETASYKINFHHICLNFEIYDYHFTLRGCPC
jgi:hypothetical protein